MPAMIGFPRWRRAAVCMAALMLALPGHGAETRPPAPAADGWGPVTLARAVQRDVVSASGRRYRIFVARPNGAPPPAGYPVIYALDGNASFPSLALMNRTVERRSAITGIGPALVVGIGYAGDEDYAASERSRDYTPAGGAATAAGEGGAERFLDFIERELKPMIEAAYPVDRQRQALFGHSYGGLLTLHALFTRPQLFQTYIAASPSIWWQQRFVLSELAGLDSRLKRLPAPPRLLLAVGSLETPPASAPPRVGPQAGRHMRADAEQLAATLSAPAMGMGSVVFRELADENHGSVLFPSLSRGLEFFLH